MEFEFNKMFMIMLNNKYWTCNNLCYLLDYDTEKSQFCLRVMESCKIVKKYKETKYYIIKDKWKFIKIVNHLYFNKDKNDHLENSEKLLDFFEESFGGINNLEDNPPHIDLLRNSELDKKDYTAGESYKKYDVDAYLYYAVKLAMRKEFISISYLQRWMSIGYSMAVKIIDKMIEKGYISSELVENERKVLITPEKFLEDFGEE